MQYNVCIWALSGYNEQKDKKYAIGNKYIFIFSVSSQIVTWY